MGHGTTCLSAVVVVAAAFPGRCCGPRGRWQRCRRTRFRIEPVALTTSQNLLATDPNAIARFLESARPAPVSSEDKARVLSDPSTGRRGHRLQRLCAPEACGSDHAASGHRARVGVRNQGDRRAAGSHRHSWASRHPHLGSGADPARCGRTPGLGGARSRARVRLDGTRTFLQAR